MASCTVFAERVKLSGSAPERSSLEWVQATLDAMGFRTALLSHDAYISLPGAARVEVDGHPVPAITHSFSRASPSSGLTVPVVDVGAGRAGVSLRGCIALMDGIASPAAAALLLREGAVGQLHISPHEHLHEMCISPVWGTLASKPWASFRPRLPAQSRRRMARRCGSGCAGATRRR